MRHACIFKRSKSTWYVVLETLHRAKNLKNFKVRAEGAWIGNENSRSYRVNLLVGTTYAIEEAVIHIS